MPHPFPIAAVVLSAGVLLAGCARHGTTRALPAATAQPGASTAATGTVRPTPGTPKGAADNGANAASTVDAALPARTGIPACDDYLSSYLACHRAAQIYAPDQLPSRYEAIRTSLLRDSQDSAIRPQLAARCNSLATQLRQVLHGKACIPDAAHDSH